MKNNTVLHANNFGIITQCKCCTDLQLTFGTLIINLSEREFYVFKSSFFELNELNQTYLHSRGKINRYRFVTSYKNLSLSLSKKEYTQVCELLNLSTLLLDIENSWNKN